MLGMNSTVNLNSPLQFQDDEVVRVENVTKIYGKTLALSEVSFRLHRNQICCVVGKNCSGKSTLLRILSGFSGMTSGTIYFNHEGESSQTRGTSGSGEVFNFQGIGYCAQENNLPPNLTCSEIYDFFYEFKGGEIQSLSKSKIHLIEQIGLNNHLQKKYGELSVGIKRKFSLLLALISEPSFILMDEPVSGLDLEFQQQFWDLLGILKANRTIVVVSHQVNPAASIADQCIILDQGEMINNFAFSDLTSRAQGLIKIKTRIKPQYVSTTLSASDCYSEYIVRSDDLERVQLIISRHPRSHIFISTISLEELILYITGDQESRFYDDYSTLMKKKSWNQLLRSEMSKFQQNSHSSWFRQVWVLYVRRSQLLWLKPRNLLAVAFIFVVIIVEWTVMKMKREFIPYRLLIGLSAIVLEESIQNLTSFKLLLRLSGVSTFQYQFSTLMANFTLFTLLYFLLFLLLCIYNYWSQTLIIHEKEFILFIILGNLANVSFSQFLALLLTHLLQDPNVVLIVFLIFVSYCLVFIFNFSLYPGFIFPTLLSSYSITISGFRGQSKELYFPIFQNNSLLAIALILQGFFYLMLSFILDFALDRNCARTLSRSDSIPVQVNVKKKSRQVAYNFNVRVGHICCLYGPPETGKSELIKFLSQKQQSLRNDFFGDCRVLGADILAGQQLGSNTIGVCLQEDDLEQSFKLFEHLWFLGSLKGLSGNILYQQIFFVAKLLDLEAHLFKKISHLSGGTKRKASISTTLLGGPALIIIDECTKNLDPAVIQQLLLALHYFVHRLGRTLVFTSKKLDELILISDQTLELKQSEADEQIECSLKKINEWLKIKVVYSPRQQYNSVPANKSSLIQSTQIIPSSEFEYPRRIEYAVTFSMDQLKEQLVVFLRDLSQKQAHITQIILTD